MSISSVTDTTTSSSLSSVTSNNSLGKEDFLTLLVAQLENQDPLDPQDNAEFIAQMAQFSSLEQQITTNENLESLLTSNQTIEQLSAFNLLGQTVVAEQETFTLGTDDVELGFSLDEAAESVSMAILDSSGSVVNIIDFDDVESGNTFISWDGTDSDGNSLSAGEYSTLVTAIYSDGSSSSLPSLQRALVTGIDTSDEMLLETNQGSLSLSGLDSVSRS